jgi:hypothetical protein
MKKILAIFLSITLIPAVIFKPALAENSKMIPGLQEELNSIWLNSTNNADLNQTIIEAHSDFVEKRIIEIMAYPDSAKMKMGLKLGDEDYVIQQIRDMYELELDKGFLMTDMIGDQYSSLGYYEPNMLGAQYSKTYADALSFNYLLSGKKYWMIPMKKLRSPMNIKYFMVFDSEGRIYQSEKTAPSDMLTEFIFNIDTINSALNNTNIQSVDDMKVFDFPKYGVLIYVRSETNEYILRFASSNSEYEKLQEVYLEPNIFYNAKDAMTGLSKIGDIDGYISFTVDADKPNFAKEAAVLQQAGLLNGNEKGLDLLKPLTRIEATTVLVRALGLENAETSAKSYFSDIPSDNWGAKYANIACDKGIATGVGDNLFAPNDTITASQFATLILRNTGENPDWQTAINTFVDKGLITSEQAQSMDLFTRGDMAKLIYEAKQNGLL